MKLVWTKSNRILSKLIRWGLGVDCSHFLIVFESPAGGLCFESNLLGTHPKFWKTDKKTLTIVHQIDLPLSVEVEDHVWDVVVDKYDGKGYDYYAFAYFAWRVLLKKCFNIAMPPKNKWAQNGSFLCDEVYVALIDAGVLPDLGIDIAISSPHDVFEKTSLHLNNKIEPSPGKGS